MRLDHSENGSPRLTSPLRRRSDATFEEIEWDTVISAVTERFAAVRETYGGPSILYYGGGGQGNHLGGSYGGATLRALGSVYRSSALAQEKTGEFFVNGRMLGAMARGDFEHTEVAAFVGKNRWQSHGIPHARTVLRRSPTIRRAAWWCSIPVAPRPPSWPTSTSRSGQEPMRSGCRPWWPCRSRNG